MSELMRAYKVCLAPSFQGPSPRVCLYFSFFLYWAGYLGGYRVVIAQRSLRMMLGIARDEGLNQVRSKLLSRMIRIQERYHIDSSMAILLAERFLLCPWGAQLFDNADMLTDRLYAQRSRRIVMSPMIVRCRMEGEYASVGVCHSGSKKLLEDAVAYFGHSLLPVALDIE